MALIIKLTNYYNVCMIYVCSCINFANLVHQSTIDTVNEI